MDVMPVVVHLVELVSLDRCVLAGVVLLVEQMVPVSLERCIYPSVLRPVDDRSPRLCDPPPSDHQALQSPLQLV